MRLLTETKGRTLSVHYRPGPWWWYSCLYHTISECLHTIWGIEDCLHIGLLDDESFFLLLLPNRGIISHCMLDLLSHLMLSDQNYSINWIILSNIKVWHPDQNYSIYRIILNYSVYWIILYSMLFIVLYKPECDTFKDRVKIKVSVTECCKQTKAENLYLEFHIQLCGSRCPFRAWKQWPEMHLICVIRKARIPEYIKLYNTKTMYNIRIIFSRISIESKTLPWKSGLWLVYSFF